jgi:hypothetical protein
MHLLVLGHRNEARGRFRLVDGTIAIFARIDFAGGFPAFAAGVDRVEEVGVMRRKLNESLR